MNNIVHFVMIWGRLMWWREITSKLLLVYISDLSHTHSLSYSIDKKQNLKEERVQKQKKKK